ncbi:MAG: hypothetical protein ACP5P7_03225, partial [Sulfurihydrogenibium sp.]
NEKENPNALSLEENVNNLAFGLESLKSNSQSRVVNVKKNIPEETLRKQNFTNSFEAMKDIKNNQEIKGIVKNEEVGLKHSLKDSKLKDLLKSHLNVENKTDKINAFTLKEQKNEHKLDDFLKKLENKEEKAENLKVNDDRNLLINISKNVEQKTDTNTDKPNKNEPFASAYQNAQSVNYDITSGYNSSKSFSDQQQNGQQTPQPNSHVSNYTTNFQINYQDTSINATISKNIVNMFIRSSDIVFTPEMIDGIKNILENSGYKDLRLTLRDKEKVYKFNFSDMNRTETKKGINLVV